LKAFSRLSAWLTRNGGAVSRPAGRAPAPQSTLSRELELVSWEKLLDDMDRFAASFDEKS
jgi:hypothetical protein